VYCEDYAGYFTVILPFLAFYFCSAYFIYLVSCKFNMNILKLVNISLAFHCKFSSMLCPGYKEEGVMSHIMCVQFSRRFDVCDEMVRNKYFTRN
jgi:hypothetical protein